ncbi:restriction endonuclease [Pseudomonas sp. O39]|uniref:restriction endonuclease n=1 Tax=Pseudomonas sp. O39 TaxID=3379130 RepID=UPI00387AA872
MKIAPRKVRYIKLGFGGEWESSCIEQNTIRLGYRSPLHQDSLDGNWDAIHSYWVDERKGDRGTATRDINQIRDFYELDESDLWITFHKKKLYWCCASKEVIEQDDKSRIRKVVGHWSSCDIYGKPLRVENMDGRLTKVQGFRGTICGIGMQDYLIDKINGHNPPEVEQAKSSLERLKEDVQEVIKGLWWHDFELLIDLIFSKSGWQRFSVLGKTEKDIDLDVYSPSTQRRAFVQIKSSTTRAELQSYIEIFREYDQFHEMYFVYHTSREQLMDIGLANDRVHLWDLKAVASLVVSAGLVEWLLNKRS